VGVRLRVLARQLRDEAANPGGMQRDGNAVGRHVDPLDQQPQDARLLGRVELVPDRLERAQRVDHLALLEDQILGRAVLPANRGDGDQLGRSKQPPDLAKHQSLRLASSDRPHGRGPCGSPRGRCSSDRADRADAYGMPVDADESPSLLVEVARDCIVLYMPPAQVEAGASSQRACWRRRIASSVRSS
jgi:hypothetical protein